METVICKSKKQKVIDVLVKNIGGKYSERYGPEIVEMPKSESETLRSKKFLEVARCNFDNVKITTDYIDKKKIYIWGIDEGDNHGNAYSLNITQSNEEIILIFYPNENRISID